MSHTSKEAAFNMRDRYLQFEMKTILIFVFSLLVLSNSSTYAQNTEIKGNLFDLRGKLIREAIFPPGCGTVAFAMNLEFKVIEYSDSEYQQNTIDVLIPCAEFYPKDFFQLNKLYSLKLSDKNQADFEYLISPTRADENERVEILKLWALDIKLSE